MFETAELGRNIERDAYDKRVPELRVELLAAQAKLLNEARSSVVVVIAGVDGAGKGDTVNTLHEWMDSHYLETHAFGTPSEEERERPAMWRFWRELPVKGRIGIYFGSWYTQPIIRRVYGQADEAEFLGELRHIQDFERMLAEDGTLVLKYWFHLSKKEQKKRLKKLSSDPDRAWRVGPTDREHSKHYDDFVVTCERALRETSTGMAPWQVIEGTHRRYREVAVAEHLLAALRGHLEAHSAPPAVEAPRIEWGTQPTVLSALDMQVKLPEDEYEAALSHLQARLNEISRDAQATGATLLCVFEGPDAAGKGGAIRRVTRALDARAYRVISTAAPSDEEKARHYLWRFWRHIPRAGRVAIFDRSWYGRVLVERVEGYASPAEWRRAYNEISEFEELLIERGVGLVKFWLHIDLDEQAKRFEERKNTPYKEFKITAEDYRNRDHWTEYEQVVHEMVERTSTYQAPWTLIAANDKRHARIEVLKVLCASFENCVARARKREK